MKKNYHNCNNEELVRLFRKEKSVAEEAFNVFYRRFHIRIFAFFVRRLHNRSEAEDKHQETFEKFFKSAVQGLEIKNAESYIFKIAKNICINHELSKYFRLKDPSDKIISTIKKQISIEEICGVEEMLIETGVQSMEVKDLINIIKLAIEKLEDKYKEPFVDRKLMEMSIMSIAEKYDLSYDGAKKRVDRAMMKIKDILKPYIDEVKKYSN